MHAYILNAGHSYIIINPNVLCISYVCILNTGHSNFMIYTKLKLIQSIKYFFFFILSCNIWTTFVNNFYHV